MTPLKEAALPYETILYEKSGRIASVTLNRPQVLNAMNAMLLEELADALESFDRDDEAWVGVISGAGRSFCAGRDVQMFREQMDGQEAPARRRVGPPFLGDLKSGKPIIGAVHSHVLGLGLMLAGECDILIATEDAQLGMTEVKRSLSGGPIWGRLTQWIPSKIASEMAITGESISGREAYRLGLVNRLVPQEQLIPEAQKIANQLLEIPPLATRATVQAIRSVAEHAIEERLARNPAVQLNETEDYREAINSFLEKRKPVYRGR